MHEIASAHHDQRDGGQWFVAQHFVKDQLKPRHDEYEKKGQNRKRESENNNRIDHGRENLVFDLLRFLLKLGQPGEHDLEYAAKFACLHHADVKLVKDARVLRQRIRERAAALDGLG